MTSSEQKNCGSICQIALCLLAIVGAVITLAIVIIYFPHLKQQPLVIKLHSFSVSDLNFSNSLSTANWDAQLLFGNQNSIFEISIESFESFVYYNQQDALSCSMVGAIHRGPRRQKLVHIQFNTTGCGGEQPFIEERVIQDVKNDGGSGTLRVGLRFNMQVNYKKGPWGSLYELKPQCSDLNVQFLNATGGGQLVSHGPQACSVPFLE